MSLSQANSKPHKTLVNISITCKLALGQFHSLRCFADGWESNIAVLQKTEQRDGNMDQRDCFKSSLMQQLMPKK